jgi:hypothetical protein
LALEKGEVTLFHSPLRASGWTKCAFQLPGEDGLGVFPLSLALHSVTCEQLVKIPPCGRHRSYTYLDFSPSDYRVVEFQADGLRRETRDVAKPLFYTKKITLCLGDLV